MPESQKGSDSQVARGYLATPTSWFSINQYPAFRLDSPILGCFTHRRCFSKLLLIYLYNSPGVEGNTSLGNQSGGTPKCRTSIL